MAHEDERYYGAFCKLDKIDDDDVMTPDQNAIRIGLPLEVVHELHVTHRGKEYDRVYVHDAAGRNAGFLPKQVAKRYIELKAAGWTCHVIPTLIVYSKADEGYWAEVAIMCYSPDVAHAFDPFCQAVCKRIASGDHVEVRLDAQQVQRIVDSAGEWSAVPNAPLPHIDKNSAVYKSKQSGSEKLAQTAIEHTTGCYIVLIAVTVVVVALIAWFFFLR